MLKHENFENIQVLEFQNQKKKKRNRVSLQPSLQILTQPDKEV